MLVHQACHHGEAGGVSEGGTVFVQTVEDEHTYGFNVHKYLNMRIVFRAMMSLVDNLGRVICSRVRLPLDAIIWFDYP